MCIVRPESDYDRENAKKTRIGPGGVTIPCDWSINATRVVDAVGTPLKLQCLDPGGSSFEDLPELKSGEVVFAKSGSVIRAVRA